MLKKTKAKTVKQYIQLNNIITVKLKITKLFT